MLALTAERRGTAREAPVFAGLDTPVDLQIEVVRKLDEDVLIVAVPAESTS